MPDPGLTTVFTPGGQRIDRFSDASIQAAANAVLANIPVGTNGVLLGVTATQEDGQHPVYNAAFAVRVKDDWTVAIAYHKEWKTQGAGVWIGWSP